MDPWEALDVDDSDLPSLLHLRPCKRRRDSSSGHTSVAQSQSIHLLTPSSPSPQPSQTLDSFLQSESNPPPPPPLIPGPAGAVQSAMLRKTLDRQSFSSQEQPIATQEYIRRAIEDAEEDEDFQRNPWISAIEFLTADGTEEDGMVLSTPLNSIKKCVNIGRVDQVVAVIKSCTPNGLGDLMVTLKDPTGTVAGSIHRKVLSESEFAKDIYVGSVLILTKVAVFSPSRSAHYLNITLSNVLKVFHKDSGPPLQQKDSTAACAVKYAAPDTDQRAETRMSCEEYPQDHERTEDAMNGTRTSGIARENSLDNNHQEKRNPFLGSIYSSNQSGINITQNATMGKESLPGRRSRAKEIFNEAISMMEMSEKECRGSENSEKLSDGGNLSEGQNVVRNCSKEVEEDMRIDQVQKQKEAQITKGASSLPQWTDEQLNELFALGCEDDWV